MAGGLQFGVRHNLKDVELWLDELPDDLTEKAAVRALNRTATTVRAEAAREIRKVYNITVSDAKDQMRIENATRGRLRAAVEVSGRPQSLSGFDPRQTGAGVTVVVKRGQRKLIRHAFLLRRAGGNPVFVREGKGRLPIKKLFTLSLPSAFTSEQVTAALLKVATTRFPEAYAQEARYYTSKR